MDDAARGVHRVARCEAGGMTYDEALKLYFEGHPKAVQPDEQMSDLISDSWYLRDNLGRSLAQIGTAIRSVNYHGPNTPTKRYVSPYITHRDRLMYKAFLDGYLLQSIADRFSVCRTHVRIVTKEVQRKLDSERARARAMA